MSVQRRRGQHITFYPWKKVTSRRGDTEMRPDLDSPITVRCSSSADRSSRAELPGQLGVDVIQVRVQPNIPGVNLWAMAKFNGSYWDIVAPPSIRNGKAGVAHMTILLRRRPNDGVVHPLGTDAADG